jgi:uncharacterized protein YgfB (UPF0149 family)
MSATTIADIELEVIDRDLGHLPTDEIVLFLTAEALATWKSDLYNINQLLWDEKIDDNEGDRLKNQNVELIGDYITAVHLWAKGGTK